MLRTVLICDDAVFMRTMLSDILTQAGFANCYNISEGFEGDKDEHGRRGSVGGWKAAGLPWMQS